MVHSAVDPFNTPRWCRGTASVSGAGGRGFDARPGHTKETNGSNGRLSSRSGLRS